MGMINLSNTVDMGTVVAVGVIVIVTALFAYYAQRRHRQFQVPARDVTKGHRWFYPDIPPVYCNVCELLINGAAQCDSCGIVADMSCTSKADKKFSCKPLASFGTVNKHHWVKGNLPGGLICSSCGEEVGGSDDDQDGLLNDFRCSWCKRTAHESCIPELGNICDGGVHRDFVVLPNCVRLKLVGWKGRRHLVVGEVKPPSDGNWRPLIVIANRKSGNNDGERVLRAFRSFLNPVQVIDLHEQPLEAALQWCNLVAADVCRILVGGGDGTIGWVLDTIDKMQLQPRPCVAILPLGTGNDLSRVLGWGEGLSDEVDVKQIFRCLQKAVPVNLDRWKIIIRSLTPVGIRLPAKTIYVNNYASVGVDALIALKFHETRESKLYLYGSRLLNKFLFMSFATKDVWGRECKNLNKKVSLWLDNQRVELPEIEAIVILNIPSWCAGVRPWALGSSAATAPKQRFDDGKVEVIGVYSTFHIGQMQIGLSEPVRIGQAKEVKLQLSETMPMQVDGEPWKQCPGEITLVFHAQAMMLSCSPHSRIPSATSSRTSSTSSYEPLLCT